MASKRWFHPALTGLQAEKLLVERGVDGSFLVRPSEGHPGDFSISVRKNGAVTHIRIQNTGDYLDLYGGEKFATLAELVQYYQQNSLREKSGEEIRLTFPLASSDPTTERWYHGHLSGREAEQLLMERSKNGFFLVRQSQTKPGDYVLSVRAEERVRHVMIRCQDGKFDVGGGDKFTSLGELIDNYKSKPMVEESGLVLNLKYPFNATRIAAQDIHKRISELSKSAGGNEKTAIREEFEVLQQIDPRMPHTTKEGQRDENRAKNRYKNILPFDDTRLKLTDADPNVPGSDYINANIITPVHPDLAKNRSMMYIATQGCLSNTVEQFWAMVWQEHSRIIVMGTQEVEKGKPKCHRYWPVKDSGSAFGSITVTTVEETVVQQYVQREFHVTKNDETRTVFQYQFLEWPDHGTARDPSKLLEFLTQVNSLQKKLSAEGECGPMVVHCSAGIGRTGTIVVIDMILNQIDHYGLDSEIDIQKTILHVRDQRSGMVQTWTQYQCIYSAIDKYVETIQKRLEAEMGAHSLMELQPSLTTPPIELLFASDSCSVSN